MYNKIILSTYTINYQYKELNQYPAKNQSLSLKPEKTNFKKVRDFLKGENNSR